MKRYIICIMFENHAPLVNSITKPIIEEIKSMQELSGLKEQLVDKTVIAFSIYDRVKNELKHLNNVEYVPDKTWTPNDCRMAKAMKEIDQTNFHKQYCNKFTKVSYG